MNYARVFARLNRARVRYLVAGAVAMGLHGLQRATIDLDLMVDLEPRNLARALRASWGPGCAPHIPVDPFDFANPTIRSRWILAKGMLAFPWYHPYEAPCREGQGQGRYPKARRPEEGIAWP